MNKNRVKKFWYLAAALGIFSCAAFAYRYSGRSFDDSLRPWRDVRSEFPEIENKLAKGKYKYLEGNVKIRMKETDAVLSLIHISLSAGCGDTAEYPVCRRLEQI